MANVDFTTGTELDAAGVLSASSTTITVTGISAATPCVHLGFDRGAGYFSGDFRMRFGPLTMTSPSSNNSRMSILKVSAGLDTADDVENQSVVVRWVNTTTNPTLYLSYFATDLLAVDSQTDQASYQGAGVAAGTAFYIDLQRSGTTLTLKIYSDSGYTSQVGSTLTLTVTAHTYRYVYAAAKYMSGSGATLSGSLQNLDMDYSAGTNLTPSAASMTMTGSTPTVTTTGNQTLAPAAASLAMTGATPTVSAEAYTWYTLPAPGAYDSNSILAGQTYPTGSWLRVVTDFAHITYGYAAAEAAGELDNDINDHAVADSGYTGSDSATFEIKTPAGATAQYTVNVTIQETGITAGPSAATLTMTGATPTVTTGGNQTLSPAAAAMTMTGATPTITGTATSVAPAAASMVMTGVAPIITNGAPVGAGLPFSRPLSRGLARRIHRSLNG